MAIGMQTYDQADKRESLLSILKDTSPLGGNWLVGNLGTSTALQPLHYWTTFHLDRPTSVTTVAEGADATISDHTSPAKSSNYTAILRRVVQVTGSDLAVEPANGYDPMVFQKRVALSQLNADMEFALLNGSGPSAGASGVARGMAGIDAVISTNVTARSSGTSFSTTELEDIFQESWDEVGSEYVADTLLVTMGIKRKISGFTTNITNYVSDTDKLYRNISTYEASTGVVTIVPHKDIRNTAGTTTVYAVKKDMFRMAFLKGRQPKWVEIAKTGDADKGMYITELTLESLGQKHAVKRTGYAQNG
jgi:hypothetical protein